VKWLVTWRAGGQDYREEFFYRYNAFDWVGVVRRIWGVEALVHFVQGRCGVAR